MEDRIVLRNLTASGIPDEYRHHRLIEKRAFYTVPADLLSPVVEGVGRTRFDSDLLEMERTLGNLSGDHSSRVGFYDGNPIHFHLLRRRRLELTSEEARVVGLPNDATRNMFLKNANERLDHYSDAARGYLGWLMTNAEFLAEHDQLLRRCQGQVRDHGRPQPVQHVGENQQLPPGWRRGPRHRNTWLSAFREFCSRWRLNHLVAPGLPQPLQPQFPSPLRTSVAEIPDPGGLHFFLSDTVPITGKGETRNIMEDALRSGSQPDHIQECLKFVGSENTAKNCIGRFARLFELKHFWRILFERHSDAFHRREIHLKEAMADFFGIDQRSISKDLQFIARRLGRGWYQRSKQPQI